MGIQPEKQSRWAARLDSVCAVCGGLLPLGLVIGNVAFEAVVAGVGILWMIRLVLVKENPVPGLIKHPLILPWLAWLASVIISLMWNGAGSKGWGHDLVLIRFFLYVTALIEISQRRPVFKYLLIGMGAAIVWGLANTILAYAIGYDILGRSLSRYSYKIKDAGRIASVAAYVGPFFLTWGMMDRNLSSAKKAGVILIGFIALIQAFHIQIRTVEIATISSVLAFAAYMVFRYSGLLWTFLLVGLCGLAAWLFIEMGPRIDWASTYDRIGYWKVVWAMWWEHPFVGVGVSAWQDAYKEMAASGLVAPFISPDGRSWKALNVSHAHNLFLEILSCTGILGLSAFCWLLINAVREVIRKINLCGHAMITWPVVFFVIGLTGWNIYGAQYQTIFAFLMALTGVYAAEKMNIRI